MPSQGKTISNHAKENGIVSSFADADSVINEIVKDQERVRFFGKVYRLSLSIERENKKKWQRK